MKKILISLVIVIVFGLVVWFQRGGQTQGAATDTSSPAPTPDGSTATPDATVTPSTGTSTQGSSGLKDGSYTSAVFDAQYGSVQVKITVSSGKMTNIAFLQYPDSPGNTIVVSNHSLPILKSEAIAAQSAQVDIVSGATQTSEAFIQAIAGALVKARG